MNEDWRPIAGLDDRYEVSTLGSVRNCVSGELLKASGRYPRVTLPIARYGRYQHPVAVHVLVAEAFLGPRPAGHHVCHNDGDRTNNGVANLRYGTPKENEADKVRHGRKASGERHPKAKLTAEEVRQIRLLSRVDSQDVLADHYGVHKSLISCILTDKIWKDVPWPSWRYVP